MASLWEVRMKGMVKRGGVIDFETKMQKDEKKEA